MVGDPLLGGAKVASVVALLMESPRRLDTGFEANPEQSLLEKNRFRAK